jgi:SAM-dependent methyltransferase
MPVATRLTASGHRTAGVDCSAAMLAIARRKVPQADFRIGDLTRLPLQDGSVDVAVCALALTHRPDPEPAIAELARVVRPGGTIVLSDAHPAFVQLQGQALFPREDRGAWISCRWSRRRGARQPRARPGRASAAARRPPALPGAEFAMVCPRRLRRTHRGGGSRFGTLRLRRAPSAPGRGSGSSPSGTRPRAPSSHRSGRRHRLEG